MLITRAAGLSIRELQYFRIDTIGRVAYLNTSCTFIHLPAVLPIKFVLFRLIN